MGPWFWSVNATITSPRPLRYHAGSLLGLEVETLAEATELLTNARRDPQRLRSVYDILQADLPKASYLLKLSTVAATDGNTDPLRIRLCSTYSFGVAVLLGLASCLNFLLRSVDNEPQILADARGFVDETILLADQCATYRPCGAAFLPDCLKMILATTPESYRVGEIQAILVDYEKDFEGAVFVEGALHIRKWLQRQAQAKTR